MIHNHLLIPLLWTLWLAYWLISARGNKASVRRETGASRAAHIGPIVIAALLFAPSRLPGGLLMGRLYPGSEAVYGIGLILLVAGLAFSIWARVHLGRNWSGTVTLKDDHELIRSGPYALARHPIYTGILLGVFGSAVAFGEWRGFVALLLMAAGFWRKLKLEERWMEELFGERYRVYRAEVRALIPGVL